MREKRVPICKRCGGGHYNFQSCRQGKEAMNSKLAMRQKPLSVPEGFQAWNKNQTTTVKVYGDLQVTTSGLGPVKTGKLTYPGEGE